MSRRPEGQSSPSVFFEVYALGQSIRRLLATAMANSPLTPEEYAIYSAIFEDEQITPSGMAQRLGMPLTTAMDHIARLEVHGHACRRVDPRDRRASLITLTASGLAAHREANRSFERAYASFASALTVDEATVTGWLDLIRDAVESASHASLPASASAPACAAAPVVSRAECPIRLRRPSAAKPTPSRITPSMSKPTAVEPDR